MGTGIYWALLIYSAGNLLYVLIMREESRILNRSRLGKNLFSRYDIRSRIILNTALSGTFSVVSICNLAERKDWISDGVSQIIAIAIGLIIIDIIIYAIIHIKYRNGIRGE